eukprot:406097-Pelagomonas_calceolata.AAC.4
MAATAAMVVEWKRPRGHPVLVSQSPSPPGVCGVETSLGAPSAGPTVPQVDTVKVMPTSREEIQEGCLKSKTL